MVAQLTILIGWRANLILGLFVFPYDNVARATLTRFTVTPAGSHLIVCSRSLSMRIYELRQSLDGDSVDYSLLRSTKPHGTPVSTLAVDRTSTLLATGGTDGTIKVWDIAAGYVTHTFRGPSGLVTALHFFEVEGPASDNKKTKGKGKSKKQQDSDDEDMEDEMTTSFRLVSGSQDGKVRVWDLNKRSCIANLDSHVSDVRGLDYSPEQRAIVSASRDKTLIWWDARSWKIRKIVPCLEQIEAVGFVDDGNLTYSAGETGRMRIWDTDTGREVTQSLTTKSEEEGFVAATYMSGLPFILAVQVDHTIALFKLPSRDEDKTIDEFEPFRRISGTHDDIIDLGYMMPDRSLLALATNSEDIRLVSVEESTKSSRDVWNQSEAQYFGQDVALLKGHDDIIISLDIDWSGHWIATGAKDNTAKLWRVDRNSNTYECWATFVGHAESLGAVALPRVIPAEGTSARNDPFNHPPAFLITGSQDQTVKRWDIPRDIQTPGKKSSLRAVFTRKAHDKDINAINVQYTGKLFASASQDKTVKIWSSAEGEVQGILRGHKRGVWSVQFSPSDIPTLKGDDGPVTGKGVVLTGSGDKSIKLWSLADYTCIRTFEGHSNSILKVTWLKMPENAEQSKRPILFASAAGDGLVKIWDANTGESECTLDNHEDRVWALAVHPKTNTIVSGSGDSTVSFWKDTSAQTQAAVSKQALELIEQEQELQNHIHAGSYREAITLALQLNHPGRLLALFTSVVTSDKKDQGSLSGLRAVDEVLGSLSDDQIFILLLRLRDWNTNARTAPVAQRILWTLVRSYPANKFSNLSVKGARGQQSLKEVLHAIKAYTERHYRRMEELVDESFLVEYTLQEMDNFAPSTDEAAMDRIGVDGDVVMAE